jgi:hypothetical protein
VDQDTALAAAAAAAAVCAAEADACAVAALAGPAGAGLEALLLLLLLLLGLLVQQGQQPVSQASVRGEVQACAGGGGGRKGPTGRAGSGSVQLMFEHFTSLSPCRHAWLTVGTSMLSRTLQSLQ